MTRLLYLWVVLTSCSIRCIAQDETHLRSYIIDANLIHLRQLDRHASPIIYALTAPQIGLGVQKVKQDTYWWEAQLNFSIGQIKPADRDLYQFQSIGNLNTILVGLRGQYLRHLSNNQHLGVALLFGLGIDFEGIAQFPWSTGQGYLGVSYRKTWTSPKGNQWIVNASLPVVGLVIRQPYNFIPRRDNETPGVSSLLATGTKLASWGSYQRADLAVAYRLSLNDKWAFEPGYRFSWFHYELADDIRAYQQTLHLRLVKKF